ncbi:glycoside hydrolase family 44 protein [Verrucomicrobiota bacterium]
MKKVLFLILLSCLLNAGARECSVEIDADAVLAQAERGKLLGVNIAVYNSSADFEKAMTGPIADLATSLVRMPGGSVSDKYYWNGNGVIKNGKVDQSKFKDGYWQVDYSAYQPGFAVDNHDWSKANPGFINIDAKAMHEITRKHPAARNLVTINMGTGTAEMAAEWVRWANIENNFDVKYWEMGNELNGEWEAGHIMLDGSRMTADKYVKRYIEFAKAMKAVDPTIKIGGPSCDVEHHDDYFEPLLRDAGEYVDFITLHYYSLRSSLAPEPQLFDGLGNMPPIMGRLNELLEKYLPKRKDEIEVSITEWNSKLPKDQDAYRLFNGLWFSSWIGEMMVEGVDSATVWDMFSGEDFGHGLLVQQGDKYVPTGRYWAFWLWSHYMADTMVKSSVDDENLHVYATRNNDSLYVMLMNESRTESYPITLDLKGFKPAKMGKEVTLSSREYFWNPYGHSTDWNFGPRVEDRAVSDGMAVTIPPYCVKVFQFSKRELAAEADKLAVASKPELRLLLPESEFGDLEIEGWVRVFEKGTDQPFAGDLASVQLSVEGPAVIETSEVKLSGAATRFVVKPTGPGNVTVKAASGKLSAERQVEFKPVDFEEQIVWNFESAKVNEPLESQFKYSIAQVPGSENKAVRVEFDGEVVSQPKDHAFDIMAYPRDVPKERIGGVVFDILLPEDLQLDDPGANLQAILQSHGAYWIPCGQISLAESRGTWRTVRMEIPNKEFLKVMGQAFSILFLMSTEKTVTGPIYLDNIGFMLRPE